MHLESLLPAMGYFGITAIIFAESGLLIGFFLPGDSLLFTAGFLASQGIFNIYFLAFLMFAAAVIGDSVGYAFGSKVGKRLFQKKESVFFHPDHLKKAESFYEKHGKKTIVLARFLPVIRTFAPIVAGIGNMRYREFLTFNVIGGLVWSLGLTYSGYFLGKAIPDVDKYLLPIIVLIIILSTLPQVIHIAKDPVMRKQIVQLIKRLFKKAPEQSY
ncbi:MAG: DedA family protein [Bacteroidetes bacterium]|nr:MAG: DedA family protein [Bacteroidota bacterium]